MMHCLTGTSGYSYPQWIGGFYPAELKRDRMLTFYASRLGAVELNNTFYRMPNAQTVRSWRERVPEDFRFAVKASRRISHFGRLDDVGEAVSFLQRSLREFGDALGAVLVQLPPHFKRDDERLCRFLEAWGQEIPIVLEVRHPSWMDSTVLDIIERGNAALCVADNGGDSDLGLLSQLRASMPFCYCRMRAERYGEVYLEQHVNALRAVGAARNFVFFKHEGVGPDYAERYALLAQS